MGPSDAPQIASVEKDILHCSIAIFTCRASEGEDSSVRIVIRHDLQ